MNYYHLTCKPVSGYFRDSKVFYSVPGAKVRDSCKKMCFLYSAAVVFVYRKQKGVKIGNNEFLGTYSAKYDNFRNAAGVLHRNLNF